MYNYKELLVPKCYTRGYLNRPRRSRSHAVKIGWKKLWKAQENGFADFGFRRRHGS